MLTDWRRERFIRGVLRKLSRQRVALLLQPGDVWVVENAVTGDELEDAAMRTCHMRGWTEPMVNSVPKGALAPDGSVPKGAVFSGRGPIYRLTDAGWNVVHRTHGWIVVTCLVSVIALFAAVFGIVLSLKSK